MVKYRQNPHPTQAYRLTMRIDNAPGPLKIIVSAAQYDVVNSACLPPPNTNPGGHLSPIPTNDIPFALTRVSDNEYAGVVYADGMIDADYHGRGVCRWQLIQAQMQLKATGAPGETQFIASIREKQILAEEPVRLYFWKQEYPRSEVENLPYFGDTDRTKLVPHIRDEDLFTVTLAASKEAP